VVGWFRRPIAPRDRHSYPQAGYVTVVSGDLQEWEFVRAPTARRAGENSLLAATVEPRWLNQDEAEALVAELNALLGENVRPDDGLDIRRAVAIAQFGVDTGTGIQVVPPG
jgi:hypothetical protein